MPVADPHVALALSVIDQVWDEVRRSPLIALATGAIPERLPDLGVEEAARLTRLGENLLCQIDAIQVDALPADLGLTLEVARYRALAWERSERWYWLVVDAGFPTFVLASAYGCGYMLSKLKRVFSSYPLLGVADRHRYIALVQDYARLISQIDERTRGQAQRGILIPKAQLALSVPLMRQLRAAAMVDLDVATDRVGDPSAPSFLADLRAAIEGAVLPAFDSLIAGIEDSDYAARAPEAVGIGQYPGGAEVYAELVRQHTMLDLTPEQVHTRGHARMREIQNAMRALLDDVGFSGTPQEYLASLLADPAWRAETPEALAIFFQKYIDRIAPHINRVFRFKPNAGYGVKPLAPELTGSMTFGYYSAPSSAQSEGLYLFNATNLAQVALPNIGSLNYHELVPGHHFHLASQRENKALHPLRQHTMFNAFNEGWAEYAATLAGELGMYEAPEEQFGRLMSDAFLTCRLVVDTGTNALGWSLEQAQAYMNEHSFMPEHEVNSETVRYSCGLPGQALAYKLGEEFLIAQRERMRRALGDRFDLRDFHDAVLTPGGLPFGLVSDNIDQIIQA